MHLLKSGSKQSTGERNRKKFDLLGDFKMYKESKRLEKEQQNLQSRSDQPMAPLPQTTEVPDVDLKKKKK